MKNNYNIITIGCQMNVSDSERLSAFLESSGFKFEKDPYKASFIIINTCGVKQMAEDRAYGLIHNIRKANPGSKIALIGCLSRREDVMKRLIGKVDWFLPSSEMIILAELFKGEKFKAKYSLDDYRLKTGEKYLKIKPKYENKYSAYVPIGNGCNNFCSYCVVPYARGREVYRPAKDIINEVKDLIASGYKEITLIAQNVNSYKDKSYDFTKLLKAIVKIPGDFWIRFSSSHPKDMSNELIELIGSSNKICYHLHLAMQSGDDKILKSMNRKYTIAHYKSLIKKIRKSKPGLAITTDIIVGFPGEGKINFKNTLNAFKEIGFDMAYISQYSPRYGTASFKMKDSVSKAEKKKRFDILNALLKKVANESNKRLDGEKIRVLVDGVKKNGKYYGKSSCFKTVLIDIKGKKIKVGEFSDVLINKTKPFGLEADLLINKKG